MTPVDQLILHLPDKGLYGDCQRASIASLLDLPIDKVPHFLFDNTADNNEFNARINQFLAPRGLGHLEVCAFEFAQRHPQTYHLIYGPTDRDTWHAVVGCNGQIVHDPHPSKSGLDVTRKAEWTYGFLITTGGFQHDRR